MDELLAGAASLAQHGPARTSLADAAIKAGVIEGLLQKAIDDVEALERTITFNPENPPEKI